jgi:Fic family protein
LLYLSLYFKQRRAQYYDRLMAVRDAGDWEGWIEFFLEGVREVSAQATLTAQNILELQRRHQELIQRRVPGSVTGLKLLDLLFRSPVVSAHQVARRLDVSYPTANNLLSRLEKLRLLREVTGHKRNRFFSYDPYLNLFKQSQIPKPGPDQPLQTSLFTG